jgi:hypothetical protein
MLSLLYIMKVSQNGGRRLRCIFCTAWLSYADLFERFLAFPGWFQLLLQFLPQDHVVSPLESRNQALHVPPEKEIRGRGPGYWASTSNPSVAKRFIQILTDDVSEVWRSAIMPEAHFATDLQRQRLQQLG